MGATKGGNQRIAGEMQNMMRENALRRQEMMAPPIGRPTPFEASAPQSAPGLEAQPQTPPMDQGDQAARPGTGPQVGRGRSGILFGPGRASRLPDQGSPEYEQLLQRVRGLAQMK